MEVLEVSEGIRPDLTDGVSAQDVNSDQAGHVGEVAVPQRCDEVVHQPELRSLPVNVGWYKKEARLGTQHRVGRHQVLAGAAFRTQHGRQGGVDGGQEDKEEGEEERAQMRGDGIHYIGNLFINGKTLNSQPHAPIVRSVRLKMMVHREKKETEQRYAGTGKQRADTGTRKHGVETGTGRYTNNGQDRNPDRN
ncbi:hypothetical protein F7725_020128 [Dissostichus mawsoni]|uniref:Uncharacterized protein n=1 Tax=Dissostichus mawsoni TaxID=36200 RepID=A0A7J5YCE7_DISMA|nr:hypothetical protein F7725_020128 [Dissostichus mawsoni]